MSDIDKWIEIAKECKYLPEYDLKVKQHVRTGRFVSPVRFNFTPRLGYSSLSCPCVRPVFPPNVTKSYQFLQFCRQKLCDMVCDLLLEESNIQPVSTPVTVCGDIHGQVMNVRPNLR